MVVYDLSAMLLAILASFINDLCFKNVIFSFSIICCQKVLNLEQAVNHQSS